jgi:hypothetical protein
MTFMPSPKAADRGGRPRIERIEQFGGVRQQGVRALDRDADIVLRRVAVRLGQSGNPVPQTMRQHIVRRYRRAAWTRPEHCRRSGYALQAETGPDEFLKFS